MTTDLHDAIERTLRGAFPEAALPTCEKYPDLSRKLMLPGVLIELSELAPGDDPGTGELAFDARFTAYVVLPRNSKNMMAAANLAAHVALVVYQSGRFGQAVGPARITRVAPDDFKPELIKYMVWAVEWVHEIRLGVTEWDGDGITPTEIYLGIAPNIGADHADDYRLVTELP